MNKNTIFVEQKDQLKNELSNITANSERSLMAANSYSDIVDRVNEARKLVQGSQAAANNATELVSNAIRLF